MMSDNISPEERLLNVIEKGEGASSNKIETEKAFFDLKSVFFNFKRWIFSIGIKKPPETPKILWGDIFHNIKLINRILMGITGALMIFLIIDIIASRRNIDKLYASASDLGTWQFQKRHITPLKAFSFYEEAARIRDLFNPVVKEVVKTTQDAKELKLQELTKDLSLVGIYWGTHPEVMIEDTAGKKTHFLKKGEEIKGIKIKNILEDRVILRYGDEEMEFR